MDLKTRQVKEVLLPVTGTVNIRRYRPFIDTPRYQLLRKRLQLGEAHVVYPDAQHPRLGHCMGTGKLTWRRLRRWREWGYVNDQDAVDTEAFGFLHDIGHGPRSHITDPLVSQDHEVRALAYLEELRPNIEATGADPDRIIRMMKREDPLAQAVVHTPLGADKLDYLARDAHHTGMKGMPEEGFFLDYVHFIDGELVADAKIFSNVMLLLQFYWTMYEKVYFRTAVLLTERFIQRMISVLMGQTGEMPEFTESALVEMTDSDLDYHLSHATNPLVREEYQTYLRREQPMPAVVLQLHPYDKQNWVGGHAMRHLPAPHVLFSAPQLRDPRRLYAIERQIEAALGLPNHAVLAVAPVPARRFEPPSIRFLTDSGIMSLEDMDPTLWNAQREGSKRYARFYIGTYHDYCPVLAEAAEKVREIVLESIQP